MIVNVWEHEPADGRGVLTMARERGWRNLPLCEQDVRVAWEQRVSDAPGGALLRRHLPSRQYTVVAPSFEALVDALAWEAHEWVAVEAWRAQRKR